MNTKIKRPSGAKNSASDAETASTKRRWTDTERRAVGMAVEAYRKHRRTPPLEAAPALECLGESYQAAYAHLYSTLQTRHSGKLDAALEECGMELWLACHASYFHERLEADPAWQPTHDETEEAHIDAHVAKEGRAEILWLHSHNHHHLDPIAAANKRSSYFDLLRAHCLTRADDAARNKHDSQAFEWIYQASRAETFSRGFDHLAEGIAMGQPMGRRRVAHNAGIKRWENSDEAKDREPVRVLWLDWQKAPYKYPSVAEFAREAHKACNYIADPRTIERWHREWAKEAEVAAAVKATASTSR